MLGWTVILLVWCVPSVDACTTAYAPHYVDTDFAVQLNDWNGKPMPSAVLLLTESAGAVTLSSTPIKIVTNADGVGRFHGIAVGEYYLTTESEHGEYLYVLVGAQIQGQATASILSLKWPDLPVERFRNIRGQLHVGNEKPLRLALVEAQTSRVIESGSTDSSGTFGFRGAVPGLYFLRVAQGPQAGDIAVYLDTGAARPELNLEIAFTTCGLDYSDLQACQPDANPIETPNLCGIVIDPSGAVIGDAKLELRTREGPDNIHATAVSAERDGSFGFGPLSSGYYTISASRPGFRKLAAPFHVQNDQGSACAQPLIITLGVSASCSIAELARAPQN